MRIPNPLNVCRQLRRLIPLLAARLGARRFCVCCARRSRRFLPMGDYDYNRREDAKCPWCGSMERHRLLWHYLTTPPALAERELEVLHFAPEPCLETLFQHETRWRYLTADLYAPAMVKEDITHLSFEADRFDLIICSHTLDHIPDDAKAMAELFRVLKPGGMALVISLVDPERAETRAGAPNGAPVRAKGEECIRVYGADLPQRLADAGFVVEVVDPAQQLSRDEQFMWGVGPKSNPLLLRHSDIHVCRKP